ncbi:MAG TPA: class I SAM-dependent methyltransferase [Drouetiella sp.]
MANEHWFESSAGLYYVRDDLVVFYDDWDHWANGFCRLLEISDATAKQVVETYAKTIAAPTISLSAKIEALRNSLKETLERESFVGQSPQIISYLDRQNIEACGMAFDGCSADTIFASSISGNRERLIVGNKVLEYAWQVDAKTFKSVQANSINYDELYFESPPEAHLGMRNYTSDQDWRLEKARRQLRIIKRNCQSSTAFNTALDVGCAAGYFRKALAEQGLTHYGLEQSDDAIRICKEKFGFSTIQGEIIDLPTLSPQLIGKVDLITLWDVIEHLDDGLNALNILKQFLSKDGVIVIRTPNLVSLEYEILGDYYYSFKLDHIKYFSPLSLSKVASLASLRNLYLESTSHIFKGFLGMDAMHQCNVSNTGADIIAIYAR